MRVDEICVVRPELEITAKNADEFEQVLIDLSGRNNVHIIVDLHGVTMMTTPAITTLLEAAKRARQHGGDLAVTRPQPRIEAVLRRLRLGGVLKVTQGMAEAVQLGDLHDTALSPGAASVAAVIAMRAAQAEQGGAAPLGK